MADGAWSLDRDVVLPHHQADIVEDRTHLTIALEGGLGCGKTFAALVKMLELIEAQPGVPGLWIEPTYGLIGSILLQKVAALFDQWGISWRYYTRHKGTSEVLIVHAGTARETMVYLRSAEHPERIVGFEVAWFILDEADQMDREVWRRCVQRHRHPSSKRKQRVVVYTPEPGFNWTYTVFHEERKPSMLVIDGVPTSANPHNGSSYVEDLIESHDDDERARVLTGKRTALTGLVYKRLDAQKHNRVCANPLDGQVFVGADFNWTRMAWIVGRYARGEFHIWGEVVRDHTDTIAQAEALADFLVHEFHSRGYGAMDRKTILKRVHVIPDASAGQHRTSSAHTASDIDHLVRAGFDVRRPAKNPFVADRIFSVNMAFFEDRLFIDAARCPVLWRCLQRQPWDDRKQEPSKKGDLDHAPDALGYAVYWYEPRALRRGNQ